MIQVPDEFYRAVLDFELPPPPEGRQWLRWVDTSLESPEDIVPWQEAQPLTRSSYHAESRSVVMLFAKPG